MDKYPKSIRKALRELHEKAYEREISLHIEKLWEKFQQWKNGQVNVWDITALIHEFDYHTARQLYSYYDRLKPEFTVPRAVVEGFLQENEIPPNVFESIREKIDECKKTQEYN